MHEFRKPSGFDHQTVQRWRNRFAHLEGETKKTRDAAEAERQRRAGEFEGLKRFLTGAVPTRDTRTVATADAIMKAAKTRDGGGPAMPKPTGVAAAIIAAGKKRRNEA